MTFWRCQNCGITQPTINPSQEELEDLMACCPGCGSEDPLYQNMLEYGHNPYSLNPDDFEADFGEDDEDDEINEFVDSLLSEVHS
ncbi:MAG: hypothetical protein OXU23_03675 [Candidatus Poribacteria bacterium]|nr:hypothetical protein [Candidatus Poribacteria bacterium]